MKKRPLTLEFVAGDFDSNYFDSTDCAITRALKRAGFPHLRDIGTGIFQFYTNTTAYDVDIDGYDEMLQTVMAMYDPNNDSDIEPAAFTVTLQIPTTIIN